MIDQEEEVRQLELENDIALTLEHLYKMLQEWDGDGHEEMAEEMTGHVAEWQAKLSGDAGAFDDE